MEEQRNVVASTPRAWVFVDVRRHAVFGWVWHRYVVSKADPSAHKRQGVEGWRPTKRWALKAGRNGA